MWVLYCGITSGQCSSPAKMVFGHHTVRVIHFFRVHNKPTIEYWFHFIVAISPALHLFNSQMRHWTVDYEQSVTQSVVQGYISQNILKDPVMVLFLFQCFQEAKDDQLCEVLTKSFMSTLILRNV